MARTAAIGGDGRRVADVGRLPLRDQAGQKGVDPVDDAHDVDRVDPTPVVDDHVGHSAHQEDAGVVAEHVHLLEALERGVGQLLHGPLVGDVGADRQGLDTEGGDFVGHRLCRAFFDVGHHDVASRPGEGQRQPAADATATAGHHDRATFERFHPVPPSDVGPQLYMRIIRSSTPKFLPQ
jgi:hypothetical protein